MCSVCTLLYFPPPPPPTASLPVSLHLCTAWCVCACVCVADVGNYLTECVSPGQGAGQFHLLLHFRCQVSLRTSVWAPPPRRNHYCPLLFYSRPAQRWGKEKKTPVTCAHSCLINFPSLSGRHDQGGARGVFYRAGGEGRRSDRGGAGGGRRRREDAHRLSLLGREESAHQQRGGRLPLQRSVCGSHCAALHSYAPSTGCFTRTLQHCALFNSSSSSSHMWKLFNAPWLQGWVIISRFNFKPFLLTFFFFLLCGPWNKPVSQATSSLAHTWLYYRIHCMQRRRSTPRCQKDYTYTHSSASACHRAKEWHMAKLVFDC